MPLVNSAVTSQSNITASQPDSHHIQVSKNAIEAAAMDVPGVYKRFTTRPEGLTAEDARTRLSEHGLNALTKAHGMGIGKLLWHAFVNPLVILLACCSLAVWIWRRPRWRFSDPAKSGRASRTTSR